ncbi:hypothetical protein BpHYR1_028204 [Brachionus plicatilis]|uniref:Uncharacterized protein n=1 Tax=Brachionus plicatilis TaxID=10195 RepID=A0A3M7P8E8_BRAPC|nr:hypothetical protein BpHYR1_028204 [Brachionus plicatilis]
MFNFQNFQNGKLNLAPISQTPNISQFISSVQIPLDIMMVYVRPCTKYPIHGIKACVAKQGDTVYVLFFLITFTFFTNFYWRKNVNLRIVNNLTRECQNSANPTKEGPKSSSIFGSCTIRGQLSMDNDICLFGGQFFEEKENFSFSGMLLGVRSL